MASIADLVHQQSTSTGTGNFTLSNFNGRQSFNSAFGTGGTDLFYYFISNRDAAEWEVGTGHLSASTTLVRDTVLQSSNADAAVSFSAGTKDVTNCIPAASQATTDTTQTFTNKTLTSPAISGGTVNNAVIGGTTPAAVTGTTVTATAQLVISGAGAGQIVFPASQNASANVNTLDDYEEGTWTPGISFGNGTTGLTYSSQAGAYVKVGKLVSLRGNVQLSAKGSSTGVARITGLPFAASEYGCLILEYYGNMTTFTAATAEITTGDTVARFYIPGASASADATHSNFNNTSGIWFSAQYLAS